MDSLFVAAEATLRHHFRPLFLRKEKFMDYFNRKIERALLLWKIKRDINRYRAKPEEVAEYINVFDLETLKISDNP